MRIGIIGFGFSGLMVAANLLRSADKPLTLYIIDEHTDGRGVAYSSTNPDHLLNVRASGMSAWVQAPDHLVQWLKSDDGKHAAASLKLRSNYVADDFIPRMLYGLYLQDIWHETQEIAAHKNCSIKLVPAHAVAVQAGEVSAILTARGDAIAVDKIILAAGHEAKPVLPSVLSPAIIQNPWASDALAGAAQWPSPVMLIGTGLTAVDIVLSLRRSGYEGEIVAASFSGRLPQPHAKTSAVFSFRAEEIAAAKTLPCMLQLLRTKIREVGEWRVVVDALRPHTQMLWQRFTTREQRLFLARLNTRWITHRHRMAPEIAAAMEAEMAAQKLQLIACKNIEARVEGEGLVVTIKSVEKIGTTCSNETAKNNAVHHVHRILNCAGLELNLARSANPLLRQLLASGMVEQHATGLGIVADPHYRAWGNLHPNLYVIGSLLTGQLLESTAVPELRTQAAAIATELLQAMRP